MLQIAVQRLFNQLVTKGLRPAFKLRNHQKTGNNFRDHDPLERGKILTKPAIVAW